jgi:hypothetical protein
MLGANLIEGHEVAGGQVVEAATELGERVLVGEDLGGLFECFVLVDRDEHGRGSAAPGDRDVLTTVGHVVEQLGGVGAELSDGHGFRHA